MSDNKVIQVRPGDIVVGIDEILVPNSYLSKIEKHKKRKVGILSRVFGEKMAEQISKTVSRETKETPSLPLKPKPKVKQIPKVH